MNEKKLLKAAIAARKLGELIWNTLHSNPDSYEERLPKMKKFKKKIDEAFNTRSIRKQNVQTSSVAKNVNPAEDSAT